VPAGFSLRNDTCQPSTPASVVQQTEVCWHPYVPQRQSEQVASEKTMGARRLRPAERHVSAVDSGVGGSAD
jgi:hypothetical protein